MICAARPTTEWQVGQEMLDSRQIHAVLTPLPNAIGLVGMCYTHGASRRAAAQQEIAKLLAKAGVATCIAELLDPEEADDRAKRNDMKLLAERMHSLLDLLALRSDTRRLPLALLAADQTVPPAFGVAHSRSGQIATMIACCGRPDFAPIDLSAVTVPTLLVVPSKEEALVEPNQRAFEIFNCPSQLAVIVGASNQFSEPGTCVACGFVVQQWCQRILGSAPCSSKARCRPIR